MTGCWAKRLGSTPGSGNRPEGCCDRMNQLRSKIIKTRIWTRSKKRLGVKRACYSQRATGITPAREQVSSFPGERNPGDNPDPLETPPGPGWKLPTPQRLSASFHLQVHLFSPIACSGTFLTPSLLRPLMEGLPVNPGFWLRDILQGMLSGAYLLCRGCKHRWDPCPHVPRPVLDTLCKDEISVSHV